MDEFSERILVALVEGYNARDGMKDRNRALTEYEIARRAGFTGFSYVEFSVAPERDQVRAVLDELSRGGLIREWARAGRYDSYIPTEIGVRRAATLDLVREGGGAEPDWDAPAFGNDLAGAGEPTDLPPAGRGAPSTVADRGETAASAPARTRPRESSSPAARGSLFRRPTLVGPGGPLTPEAALNRLVEQLDEALLLLRAIDAKLGRDR
jgi:hypothetical protein